VYGKTIDHVLEMDVVFSSGEGRTLREMKFEEAVARGGLEGCIVDIFERTKRKSSVVILKSCAASVDTTLMSSFETGNSTLSNSWLDPKVHLQLSIGPKCELKSGLPQ